MDPLKKGNTVVPLYVATLTRGYPSYKARFSIPQERPYKRETTVLLLLIVMHIPGILSGNHLLSVLPVRSFRQCPRGADQLPLAWHVTELGPSRTWPE